MSMHIELKLLGGFEVRVQGRLIAASAWNHRHPRQLLQMLALQPRQRLDRERALVALWPDSGEKAAANRLHHTLHLLRATFAAAGVDKAEPVLELQAGAIGLGSAHTFELDLCAFRRCIAEARGSASPSQAQVWLRRALSLHGGELLAGQAHDDWLAPGRDECRNELQWLLERLAAQERQAGDTDAALLLYQRLIEHEPANELAHRALMELYDDGGHPERALQQYDACRHRLARDLDVEPSPATQGLFEGILARTKRRPAPAAVRDEPALCYLASPQALPLFGREQELAALQGWVAEPATRLITITGPAGVGKTRLAQALIERCQGLFDHGAVAVTLTDDSRPQQAAERLALALRLKPGHETVAQQIGEHLKGRRLLILLDRLEHLSSLLALWLTHWLQAARGVKLVVTSRVPLRCAAERVFELDNLSDGGDQPAVALFCRAAANLGAHFDAGANRDTVAAICRRLGGNPLAIQLAACQTQLLTLGQLSRCLARPLQWLNSPLHDGEAPHASLRQSIEWTLRLLPAEARQLFDRLSVLADGFTLDEACQALAPLMPASTVQTHLRTLLQWHLLTRLDDATQADATARFGYLDAPRQLACERVRPGTLWRSAQTGSTSSRPPRSVSVFVSNAVAA
jgi:DNA-binding SARP family transcriptional activator